jgi:hypothetical protein
MQSQSRAENLEVSQHSSGSGVIPTVHSRRTSEKISEVEIPSGKRLDDSETEQKVTRRYPAFCYDIFTEKRRGLLGRTPWRTMRAMKPRRKVTRVVAPNCREMFKVRATRITRGSSSSAGSCSLSFVDPARSWARFLLLSWVSGCMVGSLVLCSSGLACFFFWKKLITHLAVGWRT